jgi:hypothetical protein
MGRFPSVIVLHRRKTWALAMALVALGGCRERPDPLPGFPRVMLWAWERPERMRFIDPRLVGVAFLAGTVSWRDGRVDSRPRYQPLELPPGTAVMAATRLESFSPPLPNVEAVAGEILKTAELPRVKAIQIDFDARLSERQWYAELLRRVRARLNAGVPVTITALASWCERDSWIAGLPIADAVPMLFRMGVGEPRGVRDFPAGVCRNSLGVSTDEVPEKMPGGRRLFIFHPRPWTVEAYRGAIELARMWQ